MRTAAMIGMVLLLAGAPTIPSAYAHDEWDDWARYCDSLDTALGDVEVAMLQCQDGLIDVVGGCGTLDWIYDYWNGAYTSSCQYFAY